MAILTDKEQALVGTVGITGMPTHGASFTCVVRIDLDRHRLVHKGFIGNHGLQFRKGPF